jgi:hypothetical protein
LWGYLKDQNLERITAGVMKIIIFEMLAGFKLATAVYISSLPELMFPTVHCVPEPCP